MTAYTTNDPLVVFVYLLARDACPAGEVTRALQLVAEAKQDSEDGFFLTNPFLGEFARDVVARLRFSVRMNDQATLPDAGSVHTPL